MDAVFMRGFLLMEYYCEAVSLSFSGLFNLSATLRWLKSLLQDIGSGK